MKLFLDSGDISKIQKVSSFLNIEGITTNPKLCTTENAIKIAKTFSLPTSIQISYEDEEEAVIEARKAETPWSIIKLPVSDLKTGKKLTEMGFKINFTLCFDLYQVICAANLQAEYVSIFFGRLVDNNKDAYGLLKKSIEYLDNSGSKTKIIAASIRSPEHLELVAAAGCHVATIPPKLLLDYTNPLTQAGLVDFTENKIK